MRVVIYTRVSTAAQADEGFSLQAQSDKLVDFVKLQNWDLMKVYTDPGMSAKNLNRPGVQEMIADLKAGQFNALIVHKLDRLTRNISDLYNLVELVNKLNVKLISLSENIDTSTPMGRMFVYLLGIFAQMFRENLREEVIKGMTKRAEMGLRNASTPPYGYSLVEGTNELTVDEEQTHWVRQIFDWYTQDKWGCYTIANTLNNRGIRSSKGTKWHTNIVRNVIANPTYMGKTHWTPKDGETIMRDGEHVAIVSEEQFAQAQEQLRRRGNGEMVRSANQDYPFSGILRCGRCGYPFHGKYQEPRKGRGRYTGYKCSGKHKVPGSCDMPEISETKMVELFFEYIRIVDEGINFEESSADQKESQKERKRLERELTKSESRRKNWTYAMGDGKLPYEDFSRLMEGEMKHVRSMEQELAQLPKDVEEIKVNRDEVKEALAQLKDNWPFLDKAVRKNIVQSFYKRIVIQHDGSTWKIERMELV